jgi:F420-dependent oxidoreductase-like protein
VRLGLNLGYFDANAPSNLVALVQRAEALGYHSVWTAEAYGSDAVVPLAYLAGQTSTINLGTAVMQMPARTPAATAMTAATFDLLTGGRFLLGLGLSGPAVVEGWHGVPYGKPLVKTREYVEIVRDVLRREAPLEHHGAHYDIPYHGAGASGEGKPLKLIIHPRRADLPIYLAAIGPRNVALAAEIADGWLPMIFSPTRFQETYGAALGDVDRDRFDIAPSVYVAVGDDVDACRATVKPQLALYIGGMGPPGRNFYYAVACRYGYEEQALAIQKCFTSGDRAGAAAAVPDELVDEVSLCGPKERIRDRLGAWREAPITTMILSTRDPEAIETIAELVDE